MSIHLDSPASECYPRQERSENRLLTQRVFHEMELPNPFIPQTKLSEMELADPYHPDNDARRSEKAE